MNIEYWPSVPTGGGAVAGKDPHKCGQVRSVTARQLAKKLVRGGVDEAQVVLGWMPGGDAPVLVEASTNQGSVDLQLPRYELPPSEWFTINSIVLTWNCRNAIGRLICWRVISAKLPLRGSDERAGDLQSLLLTRRASDQARCIVQSGRVA